MPFNLFCSVHGDPNEEPFEVQIKEDETVSKLKVYIKAEKKNEFAVVDANRLRLWKWNKPTYKVGDLNIKDVLDPRHIIGDVFGVDAPRKGYTHIIIKAPASITPSSSEESNISAYNILKRARPDSHGDSDHPKRSRTVHEAAWLYELHSKIWAQEDLRQELFTTVEITAAHYEELEERLTKLYPSRHSEKYEAEDVLSIKLDVLRSFKTPSNGGATHATHPDTESHEAEGESNEDDDELHSIFPFTVDFLDLSSLELEASLRMPQPLLIRQEYKFLTERLPRRSVILSGQPGTGKTSYLYIRMVDSMIEGRSFLYQDLHGTVYHVSDAVTIVDTWGKKPIIAFIDADKTLAEPQEFLRQPSVQIIVATSPRGTNQSWLKQMGNSLIPLKLITALWSPRELFITGIFLNPLDLTYTRLKESTSYFGLNPRLCFNASIARDALEQLTEDIQTSVVASSRKKDIGILLSTFTKSRMLSHTIFELSPANDRRLFGAALVGAVSQWALNLLLEAYEEHRLDAAAEFYDSIANNPNAGPLRGRMWERQVLKYLDTLKKPHPFSIRSLDDSSITKWVYPGPGKRVVFQTPTLTQSLLSAVQPIHLVPKDPNFPAIDSLVHGPDGLTLNQAAVCMDHPVAVVGLKRIQGCLKRNTPLALLRPSKDNHWALIFMVPDPIADSFKKQRFEGDSARQEWASKADQYVLGIREATVWGRTQARNASLSMPDGDLINGSSDPDSGET